MTGRFTVMHDILPRESDRDDEHPPVIIVGAGMAGLTCAVLLHEAGQRVLVLEAEDRPGGRMRTVRHPAGYLIDRGFQLVYDAYPAGSRMLDQPALGLRSFDPGVSVWSGRRLISMSDPLRNPFALARDLTAPVISAGDKFRAAKLARDLSRASWQSAADANRDVAGLSGREWLVGRGFSQQFVARLAGPYWGGLLQDPKLEADAGSLLFAIRMCLIGQIALPAAGIGAAPRQLAARLPRQVIRTRQRVDRLARENGHVAGVMVGKEFWRARAVVIATDPPAAQRLLHPDRTEAPPFAPLGGATVYLGGERNPGTGPRLVVDGTGRSALNHLASVSLVQPGYAPPGKHLLAAVVLDPAILNLNDDELAGSVLTDAARMLGHEPDDWNIVAVVRTPNARFRWLGRGQPPQNTTGEDDVFIASEATVDSSYNGAMLSGEGAARAVLRDFAPRSNGSAETMRNGQRNSND